MVIRFRTLEKFFYARRRKMANSLKPQKQIKLRQLLAFSLSFLNIYGNDKQ
jgi:hypothetical protein